MLIKNIARRTYMVVLNEFIPVIVTHAIADPSFDKCKGFWMNDGTLLALLQAHYEFPEFSMFSEHNLRIALGF